MPPIGLMLLELSVLFSSKSDQVCLEYEKRLLLRCIHHFKSDLVYNMDHMRISGIEPSSVILSQRKYQFH